MKDRWFFFFLLVVVSHVYIHVCARVKGPHIHPVFPNPYAYVSSFFLHLSRQRRSPPEACESGYPSMEASKDDDKASPGLVPNHTVYYIFSPSRYLPSPPHIYTFSEPLSALNCGFQRIYVHIIVYILFDEAFCFFLLFLLTRLMRIPPLTRPTLTLWRMN